MEEARVLGVGAATRFRLGTGPVVIATSRAAGIRAIPAIAVGPPGTSIKGVMANGMLGRGTWKAGIRVGSVRVWVVTVLSDQLGGIRSTPQGEILHRGRGLRKGRGG